MRVHEMIQVLRNLRMPDSEVEIVLHMRVREDGPEIEVKGYPWLVDNDAMTVEIWAVDAFCEKGKP